MFDIDGVKGELSMKRTCSFLDAQEKIASDDSAFDWGTLVENVIGGLTAFCGGAFVFGQAKSDLETKKVSKFSTYAGGSVVNSLKGAFAAASFCMVPYAAG